MQALAQAAALTQVREPEPVQVWELAVEPLQLELVQVQVLELVLELELVRVLVLVQAVVLEPQTAVLAQAREPPLVREPVQQPELAAIPMQARKLRVSRQQEQQQHRLPAAAQERPPYLPALPMKAPCWGVPAW